MKLPTALDQSISSEIAAIGSSGLANVVEMLSARYREPSPNPGPVTLTNQERAAYLAVRAPATYAAALSVLAEVKRRLPDFVVTRLLDLGAGPGTAAWAAAEVFDELRQVVLVERDSEWISLGRRLAAASDQEAIRTARWLQADITGWRAVTDADLVIASYALGELSAQGAVRMVESTWGFGAKLIAIIEPGSTVGYQRIMECRSALIAAGARIVAPCPHSEGCPLPPDDWCHFAERLERSSYHRRAKGGSLSYEDEKFSYVIASSVPAEPARARIIRRPLKQTGHVQLELCTRQGIQSLNVTRKNRADYTRGRKAAWGDAWESEDDVLDKSNGSEPKELA